jgi:NADH dehydrogenase (ubiquinone) flavoprotein 2
MNYVADYLEMPRMRVYEVATFYTMFHRYGRLHEGAVYMEARLVCLARESGKWDEFLLCLYEKISSPLGGTILLF